MRAFRFVLVFCVLLAVLYQRSQTTHRTTSGESPSSWNQASGSPTQADAIPAKALRVLEIIRSTGQAPEGYVGGRVFQNREGRLPADGDYREFDIDPRPEHGGRNAERIIVEWNTKKAWYTGDHYQTFLPLP